MKRCRTYFCFSFRSACLYKADKVNEVAKRVVDFSGTNLSNTLWVWVLNVSKYNSIVSSSCERSSFWSNVVR